jgi:hypothetical protein
MPSYGSIVDWKDGLKALVSEAPAFQAAVKAATAAEAAARIHFDAKVIDSQHVDINGDQQALAALMPCAFVSLADHRYDMYAGGDRHYMAAAGQIDLELCFASDMSEDRHCETRAFETVVGQTIDWIAEHCGDGQHAPFNAIEKVVAPARVVRDEKTATLGKHWFYCWYAFLFDANGG